MHERERSSGGQVLTGRTLSGLRPQVVAHRGASEERAEHTEAAYALAIEEGADAVECDVRLTADGHLVCLHDRKIDRTSTGRGAVSNLTLEQLTELDFGGWREQPGSRILTFDRLLDVVSAAGRQVGLAVETKHPSKFGSDVEEALATVLRERGLDRPGGAGPQVRVMSFSPLALRATATLLPQLPRVLLVEAGVSPGIRTGRLPAGVDIVGISTRLLRRDPRLVERHHRHGHQVHVYTADEPEDVQRCLDLGVDALITNRPAATRQAVDRLWESA